MKINTKLLKHFWYWSCFRNSNCEFHCMTELDWSPIIRFLSVS